MSSLICPICIGPIDGCKQTSSNDGIEITSRSSSSTSLSNSNAKVTQCGHIFHSSCLQKWFTEKNFECPTCRRILNSEEKLISIYPQFSPPSLNDCSQIPNDAIEKHLTNLIRTHSRNIAEAQEKINKLQLPQEKAVNICMLDRIPYLLAKKLQERGKLSSHEEEILDLTYSIREVSLEADKCGERLETIQNVGGSSKARKDFIASLDKLNKLISKERALRKTLEKKILKTKSSDLLSLMNDEFNELETNSKRLKFENSKLRFMQVQFAYINESFLEIEQQLELETVTPGPDTDEN